MSDERNGGESEILGYFQVMQAMDSLYEEYARKKGLTYISMCILETLYENGGCTQKLISEITMYPKQTVNMVIRSFSENGWVYLEQKADDRRNKRVVLTETGKRFAAQVLTPFRKAADTAFSELDPNEREIMLRTLKKFTLSFKERVSKIQDDTEEMTE